MRSIFVLSVTTIIALVAWAVLVFAGATNGWMRAPLAPEGDSKALAEAITDKIAAEANGNLAFVLLEDGAVSAEHFSSIGAPVNQDTLFQVGSLSKWIAAWGVMKLVEDGALDLDAPVSTYLTRWQLPESEFDNDGVTVRRLLSHTAGLTDGLGYAGFEPEKPLPSIEQSLTKAPDASPGADGRVRVGIEPGSSFEYSGGGYLLLQLLVEEVTGESFADYMERAVIAPLGMSRSTFIYPEDTTPNLAESYDTDGKEATRFRFVSLASTALYTNAADMVLFMQAHIEGENGAAIGRGVLKPETVALMQRPHATQMGLEIWGLGTILYAPNKSGDFVIGHDGNDEPAINAAARLNPDTGNGIIVLETGNELLATEIGGEWVFWETGKIDLFMFTMIAEDMFLVLIAGAGVIIFVAVMIGWRTRRKIRQS